MKHTFRLTSFQILALGFALLILAGGAILSLPVASRDGTGTPFFDALFTATSATCVTGLTVFDIFSQFSFFGQLFILLLIQVGGLGFMAVAIFVLMIAGRRINLRERSLMMESFSTWQLGGVVRLTKKALCVTAFCELAGAIVLTVRFFSVFDPLTSIWYGIFHSVSAFCNAGFDLMGQISPGSSLMIFATDPTVNITIALLILCGGIGFFVWDDITANKFHFSKYRLHTKIMLTATVALIIIPGALFFVLERNNTFAGMTTGQQIIASLFQAVTPRTAGFNTVSMAELTESSAFLTMVLMLIGAGPGSTGGGLKVTTFVVILLAVASHIRSHADLNIFGRRLEDHALKRAATGLGSYLMMTGIGIFVLCTQGFILKDAMFEVLSALSTVGLSTGITAQLPALSQTVIILLMYFGRVGTLAVAMAIADRREKIPVKKAVEKIIVG
jgi:trk system potassium uptake protein TrkH